MDEYFFNLSTFVKWNWEYFPFFVFFFKNKIKFISFKMNYKKVVQPIKISVVGEKFTGKTCLVEGIMNYPYDPYTKPTMGQDIHTVVMFVFIYFKMNEN